MISGPMGRASHSYHDASGLTPDMLHRSIFDSAIDFAMIATGLDGRVVACTVRMLVTERSGDLGYTAIEAADSQAALKVLQSDVRIDLLVTDVGLPGGMNGRQMADAGRVSRCDLKGLFITGYAENCLVGNDHLGPGMAVLSEPFVREPLATRIWDLISGP